MYASINSTQAAQNPLMLFLSKKDLDLLVKHCNNSFYFRCDSFYNIPTSIGKSQKSGIGLGNKTSLVRKS